MTDNEKYDELLSKYVSLQVSYEKLKAEFGKMYDIHQKTKELYETLESENDELYARLDKRNKYMEVIHDALFKEAMSSASSDLHYSKGVFKALNMVEDMHMDLLKKEIGSDKQE